MICSESGRINGVATEGLTEEISPRKMEDRTLVERERELRELARLIDDARAGDGRLALIEGPAGIGKTRLFHEGRPYAEEVGVRILAARGGELERDFGFGIVRQLLEPILQRSDPDTRADLLAGAARLAEPAFSTAPGGGAGAPDPTQATLHGLYWLVANLAELSPLLLVVDDVHWADGPSLRFLIHLARRLDGMAVSVAIAARGGEQAAAPELLRALTLEARPPIIRPEPLSAPASEILIRSRLGSDAGEMLCHACHEATGGNPFLLTELVEELRYDSRPLGEISPATVRTLGPERIAAALLVRVRRVDRSGPALAHAISILGNEATITRVSALAGLDPPVAREVAGKLAERPPCSIPVSRSSSFTRSSALPPTRTSPSRSGLHCTSARRRSSPRRAPSRKRSRSICCRPIPRATRASSSTFGPQPPQRWYGAARKRLYGI
jgi:AAA ATPase domain